MEATIDEQKKDEQEGRNWRHLIGLQPDIIKNQIEAWRKQDSAYVEMINLKEQTGKLSLKDKIVRAFKRGNTKTYKVFERIFVGKK